MKLFGPFRLDTANHCLWRAEVRIPITPKAFDVLRYLVERSDRLVTQEEILGALWSETYINPEGIRKYILEIRKVLGDRTSPPLFIETFPKRGYQFIANVTDGQQMPATTESSGATGQALLPNRAADTAALTSSAIAKTVLGRDIELSKMRNWLERALAGERQTIFVTGEPGIGKTTVLQAFLEQAAQLPGILVARGQCLEHYGAGEAYLPVLDGFSRLCRSQSGAQVLGLLRLQAPSWLAQMPSLVPQSERENLQTHVGGVTRERMLREMAEAIEVLTSQQPLLLVLEDLHWSDYSTLDLVSYLARRRDPARLMVISTYRPVDVIVGDHPLKSVKRELQAHGLCHELPLECLDEETVAEYLRSRFPNHQLPGRLRRTIYRRTEGNPLFMVNLVEYLTDRKIIVEEQGTRKLGIDLTEAEQEVPANLRQLIETQIERLSPDERAVLEAASVAGAECSCVAIAGGLDRPTEWVEKQCEELARRHQFLTPGWIMELPDGTITPCHRFIHILYRDVPYRLIPPMRRSQIHQRIAERAEVIYGDRTGEIAAELAMHFEQSRDWPRALEYLLQASQNAATRSAHHEAIDLANRGLEVLRLVAETAEHAKREMKLRMLLSVSLTAIKGFASAEVEEINARGRALFWQHGPSPELFYMLWSLNMYHQFSGNMHASLEISYQLLHLAEELKDGALIMDAQRTLGAVLNLLGRYSEALELLEKGNALSSKHRDRRNPVFVNFDTKVMLECFSALALLPLGYPDQSAERLAAGLALAREIAHPQTLVVALHIAAQLHLLRDEAPLVQAYANEAMEVADEYGLALWMTYGLIELGWAEAELGDAEGGIEKIQRGLAEYELTGAKLRSPYFLGLLADQLSKAGRLEEGLAAIGKALTLAEHTSERFALSELYRIKGELFLKSTDLGRVGEVPSDPSANSDEFSGAVIQAQACFAEALAVAKQQQARSWEFKVRQSMDRLARVSRTTNACATR